MTHCNIIDESYKKNMKKFVSTIEYPVIIGRDNDVRNITMKLHLNNWTNEVSVQVLIIYGKHRIGTTTIAHLVEQFFARPWREPIFRGGVWYIGLEWFKFIDSNGNVNNHNVNGNTDSDNNYNCNYSDKAIKFNRFFSFLLNYITDTANVINSYEDDLKIAKGKMQNLIESERKDSLCIIDHVNFDTVHDMGSFFYCLKQLVDLDMNIVIQY